MKWLYIISIMIPSSFASYFIFALLHRKLGITKWIKKARRRLVFLYLIYFTIFAIGTTFIDKLKVTEQIYLLLKGITYGIIFSIIPYLFKTPILIKDK